MEKTREYICGKKSNYDPFIAAHKCQHQHPNLYSEKHEQLFVQFCLVNSYHVVKSASVRR
jgi:hypothetical protein